MFGDGSGSTISEAIRGTVPGNGTNRRDGAIGGTVPVIGSGTSGTPGQAAEPGRPGLVMGRDTSSRVELPWPWGHLVDWGQACFDALWEVLVPGTVYI